MGYLDSASSLARVIAPLAAGKTYLCFGGAFMITLPATFVSHSSSLLVLIVFVFL
jgi:hypothetical protein